MNTKTMIDILAVAGKLKNTYRHAFTEGERRESVAEHCHRLSLMAYLVKDEFPEVDINRVILMCICHDLGESFTGDIPSFLKTDDHESTEKRSIENWVASLPSPYCEELSGLFNEMDALETTEAKLYKALDKMEAVVTHNESDINTWIPLEYSLNLTYGDEMCGFSDYILALRKEMRNQTEQKLIEAARLGNAEAIKSVKENIG